MHTVGSFNVEILDSTEVHVHVRTECTVFHACNLVEHLSINIIALKNKWNDTNYQFYCELNLVHQLSVQLTTFIAIDKNPTRDIFYQYIFVLKNSLNQRSLNQEFDDTDMWFSDSKILNIEYVGIFGVVYPVILALVCSQGRREQGSSQRDLLSPSLQWKMTFWSFSLYENPRWNIR